MQLIGGCNQVATCMHARCRDRHSVWHTLLHSVFYVRKCSASVATPACSPVTVMCILLCNQLTKCRFVPGNSCSPENSHTCIKVLQTLYYHCCNQLHILGCVGCLQLHALQLQERSSLLSPCNKSSVRLFRTTDKAVSAR